jgi:hypothetical protein
MVIDFSPGSPGGETYLIVLIWVVGGLLAIGVSLRLFWKYYGDWRFQKDRKASERRLSVSRRAMESTVLHAVVGALIGFVGARTLYINLINPNELPPIEINTSLLALSLIPWVLIADMMREYRHQVRLISG